MLVRGAELVFIPFSASPLTAEQATKWLDGDRSPLFVLCKTARENWHSLIEGERATIEALEADMNALWSCCEFRLARPTADVSVAFRPSVRWEETCRLLVPLWQRIGDPHGANFSLVAQAIERMLAEPWRKQ
ncbi:MAG: hypothetical protein WEF50_11125 [Myxococcota bacterium]